MAAITPTSVLTTEFAGKKKVFLYSMIPTSASDTVTLTEATHGIRTINAVYAQVTTGQDAALLCAHPTFSGLVITITTTGADGLAATDWAGAVVQLLVFGE